MPSTLQTKHILIVDDNPGDIDLFRRATEPFRGLSVHVAHNVMQALAYLKKMPPYTLAPAPDIIFLDIRMPLLTGETVIPLVRREAQFQKVRIVMFTSSSRPEDRHLCHGLGADDYVVKPCDWDEWQATIVQVLARNGVFDDVR